ncbi:MAG TPA: hypothetical protein ENN21_02510, partial [Spirochaetes bacterium]|nr:hypothetical protein [Spirochaetota bacterium]
MINSEQRAILYRYAYLPEHLPDYAYAVGGAEAFLEGDFLYFFDRPTGVLIFIGFPLQNEHPEEETARVIDTIARKHGAAQVALLSPSEIALPGEIVKTERDAY